MSVFRKSSQLMVIAGLFATTMATSASAAPLVANPLAAHPVSPAANEYKQTVHLVCDNYGRCYRSRRVVRAPYYDNGYYPGSYGYGPSVVFGFGGHHYDGGHGFGGHGFGGHGFGGHGFGGHGGGHHE
ncbi:MULTISPECIES: hypothetical protein [unclassified Bradyrhizobium]|jgi:hypothetical protein|uniref:hypothetical protein n=1 Tax=unclassified Bradyrhizobium TaxID=2631580 RepID=UPI000B146BCF|nr:MULTISPECIES: hypothetical protein [unclassified Bradyrhizobium]